MAISLCVACSASSVLRAQAPEDSKANNQNPADLARRVEDLEKEVERLRSELAQVKQGTLSGSQTSAPTVAPTAATAAPAGQAVTAATSVPAAAPSPTSSGGAASTTAPAAAPSPLANLLGSTVLSGFVDTYYGYNFNQPNSRSTQFRAFDGPNNQFGLNLIELVADKAPDAANSRLGYHLALGFGNAMNVINSASPGDTGFAQYLKEAYASYLVPVGKGLQVDFGKFVTPHGAEVIETKDNWNYSRGLLFTYAIPFYHFGLRTKYAFNDKYSAGFFIVNGWNNIVDNNTGKTYGATFGWNPTKKISITQNYMAGPEENNTNSNWRQLLDTVVTYNATSKLSFIANYDYGRGDRMAGVSRPVMWTGIAGYAKYAFNNRYAVVGRYEYYDDRDGFTTGTAQNLNEFTGTFERIIAKRLITRLEYRHDSSNRTPFFKGSKPVDGQDTVSAGLVYFFDTKESH